MRANIWYRKKLQFLLPISSYHVTYKFNHRRTKKKKKDLACEDRIIHLRETEIHRTSRRKKFDKIYEPRTTVVSLILGEKRERKKFLGRIQCVVI